MPTVTVKGNVTVQKDDMHRPPLRSLAAELAGGCFPRRETSPAQTRND